MTQIKYLTHYTNVDNLLRILKSKFLYTIIEKINKKIKYKGISSSTETNYNNTKFSDEFPGIFMEYISDYHIGKKIRYWGDVLIIFNNKLLQQRNYHINIIDNNGYISENITFFPNNINTLPKMKDIVKFYEIKYGSYPGNEIVFHDKISINSICELWVANKSKYNLLIDKIPEEYKNVVKIRKLYKDVKCDKNIIIDNASLPFLISLDYLRSSQYKIFYPFRTKDKSSPTHYKNIALTSGISINNIKKYNLYNPKNLDKYLIKHQLYTFLNSNREKQNFDIFID